MSKASSSCEQLDDIIDAGERIVLGLRVMKEPCGVLLDRGSVIQNGSGGDATSDPKITANIVPRLLAARGDRTASREPDPDAGG